MSVKSIGRTVGGNSIDLVAITNPGKEEKELIFITARVHPGETNSSFVCEGLMNFLLGDSPEA